MKCVSLTVHLQIYDVSPNVDRVGSILLLCNSYRVIRQEVLHKVILYQRTTDGADALGEHDRCAPHK